MDLLFKTGREEGVLKIVFQSTLLKLDVWKSQNVNAAILCLAVCVSDVMNKSGHGWHKRPPRHEQTLVLLFVGKTPAKMAAPWRATNKQAKQT